MGYEQPRSTDIGVSIDDKGLHYTQFTTDQFGSSTSNMSVRTWYDTCLGQTRREPPY